MPPVSSLIFVVILAVWAVYLVQHWVRRRDHLATARSVDRFSEAMRVLERRRALPRPDVAERTPARRPAQILRPARPEVVVKRGGATTATATVPRSATARRRSAPAQLRAGVLLAASVLMVTLVGLVALQALHWAWSFVGIALLGATVAALRLSATGATTTSTRRTVRTTRPALAVQAAAAAAQTLAPAAPRTARRAVDLEARRPAPVLYDLDAVESTLQPAVGEPAPVQPVAPETVAAQEPVEEALGGAWEPVPVPPPTYTLKARAYRPSTLSVSLPADGSEMALEEEFEELPRVHQVG